MNHQLFSLARISVKIWNSIPIELRELRKTPVKQEVSKEFLQILENEVQMLICAIEISHSLISNHFLIRYLINTRSLISISKGPFPISFLIITVNSLY